MDFPSDFDPDSPSSGGGIYGLPTTLDEAGVVLLPVPWDATTSYGRGTARAPRAILEASGQVDLYDSETGRPYTAGIAMAPIGPEIPTWNDQARSAVEKMLAETDGQGNPDHKGARLATRLAEQVNAWVRSETRRYRDRGVLVGIVGGEHSVPFGAIAATAASEGDMGILQIDAHADLRPAYMGLCWSHASIFDNVLRDIPEVKQLVQVGVRDLGLGEAKRIAEDPRIFSFFDADLSARIFEGETWSVIGQEIVANLPSKVYLSLDIDGLDPSLCPNTGTPVPGGLSFAQVVALVRFVVESGRTIVGFDLCEVAPDPSGRSDWDANVGARLLYKLIGFALQSRTSG